MSLKVYTLSPFLFPLSTFFNSLSTFLFPLSSTNSKKTHRPTELKVVLDVGVRGAEHLNGKLVERVIERAADAHGTPSIATFHLAGYAHCLCLLAESLFLRLIFYFQQRLLPLKSVNCIHTAKVLLLWHTRWFREYNKCKKRVVHCGSCRIMTTFVTILTNKEQGVQHGCAAEIIPIEPDTDNTGEGKSLILYKVRDGFMSYDAFFRQTQSVPPYS